MKNKVFVNYSEWHIGGGEICAGHLVALVKNV
jgi:hypothetical protein